MQKERRNENTQNNGNGTIKKGLDINHPYSKRVAYVDEDTWIFTRGDRYDIRGNLWRTNVYYSYYDYLQKCRVVTAILFLNLQSGRYELYGGQHTKKTKVGEINTNINPREFTVPALRRAGR